MKTLIAVVCMFLLACSGETFSSISPVVVLDSGVESGDETPFLNDGGEGDVGLPPPDASSPDSTPDSGPACPDPNDVYFQGHCFYLDGSGGLCDGGYVKSSNAKLGALLGAFPDAWQGKNYRHQVSDNACVLTGDNVQNFGMVGHANKPGPFSAGEPIWNGSSCTGVYFTQPKQLTLCETSL
jgi:hypothetical protein